MACARPTFRHAGPVASYGELLRQMDADQLSSAVQACPKKLREELFRRCGVRARNSSFSLKSGGSKGARIEKLRDQLRQGADPGDEMAEEVIRAYFYTRRELLGEALDWLNVPHREGLTDADIEFLQELDGERAKGLMDHLIDRFPSSDVHLYFQFMQIPVPE